MRFSLAVPALLAKSRVVDARDDKTQFGESRGGLLVRNRLLAQDKHATARQRSLKTFLSKEGRSKRHAEMKLRTAKAIVASEPHDHILECSPHPSNHNDNNPDVGVLCCGEHQYCVESDVSALGGVCIPENLRHRRHAQEIYSNSTYVVFPEYDDNSTNVYEPYSNSTYYYGPYVFNCDNFDPLVGGECTCESDEVLGTNACSCVSDVCAEVPALCNQRESIQFCGNDKFVYEFATSSASISVCYNMTAPDNLTTLQYCLGYSYNITDTFDVEDGICELTIGDTVCNSCKIHPNVLDFYAEMDYMMEFHCENTALNASGRIDARECRFAFEGGYSYLNVMLFGGEDKLQTKCFESFGQAIVEDYLTEAFPCDTGDKRPRSSIRGGLGGHQ